MASVTHFDEVTQPREDTPLLSAPDSKNPTQGSSPSYLSMSPNHSSSECRAGTLASDTNNINSTDKNNNNKDNGDNPNADVGSSGKKEEDRSSFLSRCTLFRVCVSNLAVQAGWSIEETLLLPYILSLGISETIANLVYLINPLLSLFLQPVMATWCDRCTSAWGRRRPFLFALYLSCLVGFATVAFAQDVIHAATGYTPAADGGDESVSPNPVLVVVVFFGVALMNLSEDGILIPARALMNDQAPLAQLEEAHSFFGSMQALGGVLGLTIALIPFEDVYPFALLRSHMQAAFVVVMLVTVLCLCVNMTVREQPLVAQDGADAGEDKEGMEENRNGAEDYQPLRANPPSPSQEFQLPPPMLSVLPPHTPLDGDQLAASSLLGHHVQMPSTDAEMRSPLLVRSASDSQVAEDHTIVDIPGLSEDVKIPTPATATVATEPTPSALGSSEAVEAEYSNSFWVDLLDTFRELPGDVFRLWILQLFWWICILNVSLWWTSWVGTEVYHGDAASKDPEKTSKFDDGVRIGSIGILIQCVVSFIANQFLMRINSALGVKTVYRLASISYGLVAVATWFVRTSATSLVFQVLIGIVSPVANVNPYVLLERSASSTSVIDDDENDVEDVDNEKESNTADSNTNTNANADTSEGAVPEEDEEAGEDDDYKDEAQNMEEADEELGEESVIVESHRAAQTALMNMSMTAAQIISGSFAGVAISRTGDITFIFILTGAMLLLMHVVIGFIELCLKWRDSSKEGNKKTPEYQVMYDSTPKAHNPTPSPLTLPHQAIAVQQQQSLNDIETKRTDAQPSSLNPYPLVVISAPIPIPQSHEMSYKNPLRSFSPLHSSQTFGSPFSPTHFPLPRQQRLFHYQRHRGDEPASRSHDTSNNNNNNNINSAAPIIFSPRTSRRAAIRRQQRQQRQQQEELKANATPSMRRGFSAPSPQAHGMHSNQQRLQLQQQRRQAFMRNIRVVQALVLNHHCTGARPVPKKSQQTPNHRRHQRRSREHGANGANPPKSL